MKTAGFKSALFGFNRKQVLGYLDETYASFQADQEQREQAYQAELHQLQTTAEETIRDLNLRLDAVNELSTRRQETIENLSSALNQETIRANQSDEQLQQMEGTCARQAEELAALHLSLDDTAAQREALQEELLLKDEVIARQATELTALKLQAEELQSTLDAVQADASRQSATAQTMAALQVRNRALSARVAKLEARLDGRTVPVTPTRVVAERSARSTEALFKAVRKEIQDALDAISARIEKGDLADGDPGGTYVDMAGL